MAAKDIVAELAVNLTLESAQFATGASKAEARAQTLEGRLKGLGSRAAATGSAIGGLAAGLGLAVGVGAITSAVSAGLEYASSLGEVAEQLGVTSKELQVYRYAATQAGISQDQIDTGLAKLTRTIGDAASGVGSAEAPFKRLGISIRDAAGNVRGAGEIIPEIAEALQKIPDPAQRAAVLVDLFGKSGQKMAPLLSGGAKGVNDLTAAAEKLNLVITDEQIKRADEAADKWAAYKQVIGSQIAIGTVEGLEGLDAFNAFMDRWAADVAKNIDDTKAAFANYGHDVAGNFGSLKGTIEAGGSAWAEYERRVAGNIDDLKSAFASMASRGIDSLSRLAAGARQHLISGMQSAWESVKKRADEAGDHFRNLWDRVVGHSYIPDMVDGIAAEMNRLQPEMVAKAERATSATGDKFRQLRDEVAALMDELFPEERQMREIAAKLDIIARGRAAGLLSGAQADTANVRAAGIDDDWSFDAESVMPANDNVIGALRDYSDAFDEHLVDPTKAGTAEVIEAYGQMAAGAIASLRGMVDSFKHGDILDGIMQILDLVSQVVSALGSIGVIKGVPSNFGGPRAMGGPVVPGKSYLVGENGPEFVSFGRRGYVHPNGSGSSMSIRVVPSPYFDVVVDGRARGVAAPMAGQAAVMGVAGSEMRMARRSRRNIMGATG